MKKITSNGISIQADSHITPENLVEATKIAKKFNLWKQGLILEPGGIPEAIIWRNYKVSGYINTQTGRVTIWDGDRQIPVGGVTYLQIWEKTEKNPYAWHGSPLQDISITLDRANRGYVSGGKSGNYLSDFLSTYAKEKARPIIFKSGDPYQAGEGITFA